MKQVQGGRIEDFTIYFSKSYYMSILLHYLEV